MGTEMLAAVKQKNGFTLFELMISITVLSVMMVLIFGSLRLGVKAWTRGEIDLPAGQEERALAELVKQQIASAHRMQQVDTLNTSGEEGRFTLKGTEKNLEMISSKAIIPGNDYGPVYVNYKVVENDSGETLMFYERSIVLASEQNGSVSEPEEELFVPVIKTFKTMRFEYLGSGEGYSGAGWQSDWSPENQDSVPLAVKLVLENQKGVESEVVAGIRVYNETN